MELVGIPPSNIRMIRADASADDKYFLSKATIIVVGGNNLYPR